MKVEKEEKAKGERTVSELDIGSERQNILLQVVEERLGEGMGVDWDEV